MKSWSIKFLKLLGMFLLLVLFVKGQQNTVRMWADIILHDSQTIKGEK